MKATCPRCGTSYPEGRDRACLVCLVAEPTASVAVGGGAFEIEEEIGRGGMGVVYRGRHRKLDRTVAIKFLASDLPDQAGFEARFEREARALALLSHPNIVAVFDCGREEGESYLVLEYVDGGPLSRLGPQPPRRALEVVSEVLDALRYAHERGIVHRDVKPENILLDASGRVKVADFGIARMVGPDARGWTITAEGAAVGTPHYMAPEVLQGAEPDPRMDVYSTGVVLHQLVTGRLPIGDFEPVAGPIGRIVARALAPEPGRRYPSAAEMASDVRAALADLERIDDLSPEERNWLRAAAMLLTVATAVALWAFLVSVLPRVLSPGEASPLLMIAHETLPDGRIVSYARFEVGPALAALGAMSIAFLGQGLLRRHWREAALDRSRPDVPVREARIVFGLGLAAVALYGLRKLVEEAGGGHLASYVPIVGGPLEVAVLFFVWTSILQAWRRSRPLSREPWLWVGLGLALVPPILELGTYVARWRP